ncbi:DUF2341 domain-containing protein [Candidatus Omnitrophota bacterium]
MAGYPHLQIEHTYNITDVIELQMMTIDLAGYYTLANNIDASDTVNWNGGAGFAPVGTFTGTFDGQGHTITALRIDRSTTTGGVGLFSVTNGASISNVGLVNAYVSGNGDTGGLVGSNQGDISYSYVTGVVNGNDDQFTGGLVGYQDTGTISYSYATCNVSSNVNDVGGLVGENHGVIQNCYATGNVETVDKHAAGLVGENKGSIENSYATGNVTGDDHSGGLIGCSNGGGTVTNCYATGDVNGGSGSKFGGLIGGGKDDVITNCFSTGNVSGASEVGGFIGDAAGKTGTIINCYWFNTVNVDGIGANPGTGNEVTKAPSYASFYDETYDVYGTQVPVWDFTSAPVWDTFTYEYPRLHWENYTAPYDGLTWISDGSIDNNWTTAANWYGWLPGAGETAIFSDASSENCSIDAPITIGSLDIRSGYGGTITQGANLIITGDYSQAAGTLTCSAPQTYTFTVGGDFSIPATDDSFMRYTGDGLAEGTAYMIYDVYGLHGMKQDLDAYYKLADNIDASATTNWTGGFEPVGTSSAAFTGNFDGNYNTISNLYINRPTTDNVGLFGYANIGSNRIEKVNVVVNDIIGKTSADSCFAGGLVANLAGGTVSNSSVTLNSGKTITAYRAGGFVGWNRGTIQNSYAIINGTVSGTYSNGGFVGPNDAVVRDSYSIINGTITGTGTQSGGFVGSNGAWTWNGAITNCYTVLNSGSKIIALSAAGGFAGGITHSSVVNSYVSGADDSTVQVGGGYTEIGGFTGLNNYGTLSNDSWYTGISGGSLDASGNDYAHGYLSHVHRLADAGYGTDSATASAFFSPGHAVYDQGGANEWDFTNNWHALPNDYPFLQIESETITWEGDAGGSDYNWSTAANWDTGTLPTEKDYAVFSSSYNVQSAIDSGFSVYSLTINSGYTATITQSANLTIHGDYSQAAGTFTCSAPETHSFTVGGDFTIPATDNSFMRYAGDGLAEGTAYMIYDVYGLQAMKQDLDAYYKLANDIDASGTTNWSTGAGFEPVGTPTTAFGGNFDGQDHTITGLYINRDTISDAALFGYTSNPTIIRDVGLLDVNITGLVRVGALVGRNYYSDVINSYVIGGTVHATDYMAGGLIGDNYRDGTVTECYAKDVTVSSASRGMVGGLVAYDDGTGKISRSYAENVTVSTTVANNWGVGGLVGHVNNSSTIENCYSTGTVTASSASAVGGLIGFIGDTSGATIKNSYSTANVTGASNVGGLIGDANRTTSVINSYSTGEVTATGTAGKLIGHLVGSTTNCGVWTGAAPTNDIGNPASNLPGNRESNKSAFYSSSHAVYDQGGANEWDFATAPVWVAYPTELPRLNWEGYAYVFPFTWTYDGTGDNFFSIGTNWYGGSAPGESDKAVFSDMSTEDCLINGATTISELDILSGYTGTITLGASLTVGGNIGIADGTLLAGTNTITVAGNWTNSGGTFDAGAGAVTFDGTSGDITTGGESNAFYNLTVADGSYTLADTLYVGNDLTILGDSYNYKREVTVHNEYVDGDLIDFPMLFKITDASILTDANIKSSGSNYTIKFTNASGEELPYEVESYTPGVSLYAWVKIDELKSSTDTTLYFYYGNSQTASTEQASNVWSDNGYTGVWHLDEPSGNLSDSTSNGNTGIPTGVTQGASGQASGATSFDGSSDWIDCGTGIASSFTGDFTVSAWFKFDSTTVQQGVWAQYEGANRTQWVYRNKDTGTLNWHGNGGVMTYAPGYTPTTGDWTNIVWRHSGTYWQIFVDGNPLAAPLDNAVQLSDAAGSFTISFTDRDWFSGDIDEARVSNTARSLEWIGTEYYNQDDPSAFHTQDIETSIGAGTLVANDKNIEVGGNWTNDGGTFDAGTGTVYFNGTSILTAGGAAFNNIHLNSTLTLADSLDMAGNLTIGSGSTLDAAGYAINIEGSWLNNGGIFVDGGNTVTFDGTSGNITTGGTAGAFNNLTLESGTYTLLDALYVDGNLELAGSGSTDEMLITIPAQTGNSAPLSYFPMLVTIDDPQLANKFGANGELVDFKNEGGQHLNYEVESCDNAQGKLVVWVSVDSISNTADTDVHFYYNLAQAPTNSEAAVWDSNYVAVWHLNETSGQSIDSTSYGNDGDPQETPNRDVTGKIAGADNFDSSGDCLVAPNSSSLNDAVAGPDGTSEHYTVSLWMKPDMYIDSSLSPERLAAGYGGPFLIYLNTAGYPGKIAVRTAHYPPSGITHYTATPQDSWDADTWYYVTTTFDRPSKVVYINGAEVASDSWDYNLDDWWGSGFYISWAGDNYFPGTIDEVRVTKNIARSTDWIATEFANQTDPGAFYTTSGGGAILNAGANNITVAGNWTNSGGTFDAGTGTVTFNNTSAAQSIIGGTGVTTQTFNNITIEKNNQAFSLGGSTTTLTLNGTLQWASGNTQDITTGGKSINLGTSSSTFDTQDNNVTLSGMIVGTGGLTKIGTGTLTLEPPAFNATGGTVTYDGLYTVQTFTSGGTFTPSMSGDVEIYAWGAGGAGGTVGSWNYGAPGGAGGAATGIVSVTASTSYAVVVGGGGVVNSVTGAVGGGGAATNNNVDNRYSGGGGGYSGFFLTSVSQTNALIIAGGGGGGGSSRAGTGNAGGAGGGSVGQVGYSPYDGKSSYGGNPGTQTAAGADASTTNPNAAGGQGALQGGVPRNNSYGGGGGGGYWGGSAGGYSESNTMGGGGGGSAYYNPAYVTSATLTAGSGTTAGDSGNSLRGSAGNAGVVASNGSDGIIIVRYSAGNTYSGGTTIIEGTINFSSGGLGSSGDVTFGGGTLQYAVGNTEDISSRIKNSTGPINIDTNSSNITFAGVIDSSNIGGLTKSGTGTLTLEPSIAETQTFTSGGTFTPQVSGDVEIYAWGAGGAGGTVGSWNYGAPGGAGGAATGIVSVTASTSYAVVVGGGGVVNSVTGAVGGGGAATNNNVDNRYSGGGGGYSGFFLTSVSQTNALIIAGGGGGGGSSRAGTGNAGGAGGGSVGQVGYSPYDGKSSYGGNPGTQTAAGADASTTNPNAAGGQGALQGGVPRNNSYGGGGGGGYWGGSAGGYSESNTMGGGGGGSAYYNPAYVTSATLTAGSGTTAGDSGNSLRGSAGNAGAVASNGADGVVIVSYHYSAANTYTGGTTINAGTLVVANSDALSSGNMTLNVNGTLDASTASNLNIGGDWTNNGGTFTAGAGTVCFNGTSTLTSGGAAFSNIELNSTLTLADPLDIDGNLTIGSGSTFDAAGNNIDLAGNWNNQGGIFIHGDNTVTLNAEDTDNIIRSNQQPFFNLTVASGIYTLEDDLDVDGDLVFAGGAGAADTMTITIDHTKVASNLADFPVLVHITDTELSGKVQSGSDYIIKFTNASEQELPYEVEYYNDSTGDLVAWVKVDALSADMDTTINFSYNLAEAPAYTPESVWGANYAGVWHMNETSGAVYDSTSYSNDGSANGGISQDVIGKIAGASAVDATGEHIKMPFSSSLNDALSGTSNTYSEHYTVSLWFKPEVEINPSSVDRTILVRYGGAFNIYMSNSGYPGQLCVYTVQYPPGSHGALYTNQDTWNADTWYYVAATFDRPLKELYTFDESGALESLDQTWNQALDDWWGDGLYLFGHGSGENFLGTMDEVRISKNLGRSTEWTTTEYNNQSDPGAFYGIESSGGGATLVAGSNDIHVAGNWTNNGTFDAGTGTFVFNPSVGGKTITTNGATFYDVKFEGNGDISIADELTVTNDLIQLSGTGVTTFDGIVGVGNVINLTTETIYINADMSADNGMMFTAGGSTTYIGADLTTDGDDIAFTGPAVLTADVTLDTGVGAGDILFNGTLDSDAVGSPRDLTLIAGSGTIVFTDAVGLPPIDLSDGLISQWSLNDDADDSTVVDSYDGGNGYNDGDIFDSGSDYTSGHHETGHVGSGALSFNGTDEYVKVTSQVVGGLSEITVSGWVYYDQLLTSNPIVDYRKTDNDLVELVVRDTGEARFYVGNNSTYKWVMSAAGEVSVGEWTHIAGTWASGEALEVYVNGSPVGINNNGALTGTTVQTGNVFIGAANLEDGHNDWYSDGTIDEVRIYNKKLSPETISNLYNGGNGTEEVLIGGAPLGNIVISSAGNVTVNSTINAASFVQDDAAATTNIGGNITAQAGEIRFDGPAILTNNVTLDTSAGGANITFGSALDPMPCPK